MIEKKSLSEETTPLLQVVREAKKLSPEEGKRVAEKFKHVLSKPPLDLTGFDLKTGKSIKR